MTKDFIIGVACGIIISALVFTSFVVGAVVSAEVAMDRIEKTHGKFEVLK